MENRCYHAAKNVSLTYTVMFHQRLVILKATQLYNSKLKKITNTAVFQSPPIDTDVSFSQLVVSPSVIVLYCTAKM